MFLMSFAKIIVAPKGIQSFLFHDFYEATVIASQKKISLFAMTAPASA